MKQCFQKLFECGYNSYIYKMANGEQAKRVGHYQG